MLSGKAKRKLECFFDFTMVVMILIAWIIMVTKKEETAFSAGGLASLKYFTVLSNLLVGLTFLIIGICRFVSLLLKKDIRVPDFISILHFSAVLSVMITGVVVLFVLSPMLLVLGKSYFTMLTDENLILHFLSPLFSVLLFLFFLKEYQIRLLHCFLGMIPFAFYAIFYCLNYKLELVSAHLVDGGRGYDWYFFFTEGDFFRLTWLVPIGFRMVFLLAFLLYLGRRKINRKLPSRS